MASLPLIAGLAGAGASAGLALRSGKMQQGQAEVTAQQQELQVVQREADRKDRLASALSTQRAQAGASGISAFEGSPLTILDDSIRREEVATERDKFQTSISALAIRSAGRTRRKSMEASAILNLAQSGGKAFSSAFAPAKDTGGD